MTRRIIGILLAILMLTAMLPLGVIAAHADAKTYSITLKTVGKGSARVDKLTAPEGQVFIVFAEADEGWLIKKMSVADSENEINSVSYSSPTWTNDFNEFTMPADNVTVTVTFSTPEHWRDNEDDPPEPHDPSEPCIITFDPNGGKGTMQQQTVAYGSDYKLPACKFTKDDRDFIKWEVGGAEYDPDTEVNVTDDITVKAIWRYNTASAETVDRSVDSSTTQIVGVMKMTDLRTGNTTEDTVYDETMPSSFVNPTDPEITAKLEDLETQLTEELGHYNAVQNDELNQNLMVVNWKDDRTFTYYEKDAHSFRDENGDYYNKVLLIEGECYKRWKYTFTMTAEFTSIPMSYIHVLTTEGGFIDFWCDDYDGDYEQPYAVPEGAEVTLSAIPQNGYDFKGWYKGDVNATSYDEMFTDELITTDNPYVFESYGYPYICAVFEYTGVVRPQGDQIQVWVTDGGKAAVKYEPSVSGNPYIKPMDGTNYVAVGEVVQFWKGDEITVYQKPDDGWSFKGWYHVRIEWGPEDELPKYEGDPISTDPTFTYKPGVTVVAGDTEPLRYVCAVFEKKADPSDIILGDVDGDSEVTIVDATAIQRHLAELPTEKYVEAAADVDGDGEVTIIDATYIQRKLAGLSAPEGIGQPIA